MNTDRARAVIDFWFGPPGSPEREAPRERWFEPDPGFDEALRARFLADHEAAAAGRYDAWKAAPESCLALILLLDQLSRNLFRGSPRAFASDPQARAAARHAVEQGFDRKLPPVWRWFIYLPFEHSEALADQERSLALCDTLPAGEEHDGVRDYARRHHAIIARFGRFPHRNRTLGRISSAEEEAFLTEPGSSF